MFSKFLCVCLTSAAFPVAHAGFIDDVGSTVQGAANEVGRGAQAAGQAVADGAEQAGGAVVGGVQAAGAEVQELSGEALRAAGDKALQASGRCEYLWNNEDEVADAVVPRLAAGFRDADEDPSVDAAACERVATAKTLAMMHQHWTDVSGLSDELVAGLLNGGITASVCGPELMKTLKAEESHRQGASEYYTVELELTLREKVFTAAWIEKLFTAHCGEKPAATRLFALPSRVAAHLWSEAPTSASVLSCSLAMATAAGAGLLLVAAGRRRLQRDLVRDLAEESMLLETGTEDAIE